MAITVKPRHWYGNSAYEFTDPVMRGAWRTMTGKTTLAPGLVVTVADFTGQEVQCCSAILITPTKAREHLDTYHG